ncbi:MAG: spermidine/putrescine ABC transporter ATP-binding protein, partial [Acidimicrobiia bacterium]
VYLGEMAQHHIVAGPAGAAETGGTVLKVFELNPQLVGRTDQLRRTAARVDPKDVVVLRR